MEVFARAMPPSDRLVNGFARAMPPSERLVNGFARAKVLTCEEDYMLLGWQGDPSLAVPYPFGGLGSHRVT